MKYFTFSFFISIVLNGFISIEIFTKNKIIYDSSLRGLVTENVLHTDKEMILFPLQVSNQNFTFIFDTGSFALWIKNDKFFPQKSETIKVSMDMVQLSYVSGTAKGLRASDKIYSTQTSDDFNFVIATTTMTQPNITGVLGFARNYSDALLGQKKILQNHSIESFSIIHYLVKNKIITKKLFAYKSLNKTNGVLYLGETGTADDNYKRCFKADEDNYLIMHYWTCSLKNFTYLNPKKNVRGFNSADDYHVMFDTGANVLQLPHKFYNVIREDYVNYSNDQCYTIEKVNALICELGFDIGTLPRYEVNLGNFTIELNPEDLMILMENDTDLVYLNTYIGIKNNIWILGTNVIKNHHMIFDMEEGTIGIAGSLVKSNFQWNIRNLICIVVSFLCILLTIILVKDRNKFKDKEALKAMLK